MKRIFILVCLLLILVSLTPSLSVKAKASNEELLAKPMSVKAETIVIRTEHDLKNLAIQDQIAYNARMAELDMNLYADYQAYIQMAQPIDTHDYKQLVNTDLFVLKFPQYNKWDRNELEKQLILAKDNAAVTAIRAFFNLHQYQLSLYLFNHSLYESPSNLVFETFLYGDSSMKQRIRSLLNNETVFRNN